MYSPDAFRGPRTEEKYTGGSTNERLVETEILDDRHTRGLQIMPPYSQIPYSVNHG